MCCNTAKHKKEREELSICHVQGAKARCTTFNVLIFLIKQQEITSYEVTEDGQ
jgi:hypothetical protein